VLVKGIVNMEVRELLNPEILSVLDAYEDYKSHDARVSMYRRVAMTLLVPAGLVAWVYVFNRPHEELPLVHGGDWRAYCSAR
jgi:gamma-glutamylcyclotransferase (GGCT)/AIG2-like uncharacterized protein YtfP